MNRKLIIILSLVCVLPYAWQLHGLQPAQDASQELKPFMQRKLDYSKFILEGLTTENYEKIADNAGKLASLSLESTWNTISTQEYLTQSREFRRAAQRVAAAAREKNVDRATLGFVDLTVRCVECHTYLRKNRPAIENVVQPPQP
jgi:hypothetical protein